MILRPRTPKEVQEAVRAHSRVWPRGSGSKPALSAAPADDVILDLSGLAGMLEYDPAEFTFSALAGTPVAQVEALLAGHRQYLPFDAPFARGGATIGGAVAAGLAGPGRYRYGGVRDFVIGVQLVDGEGALIKGGGRVVKNAAGFDLPKLMVGSLGRLGALVALSFKVFPRPEAYATLRVDLPDLPAALAALVRLTTSHFDLEALDLEPPGCLWARLGGTAAPLRQRVEQVRTFVGGQADVLEGPEEQHLWDAAREFAWVPATAALVKVPLTPKRIPALDAALVSVGAERRYSVGGNVAWIAWAEGLRIADLDQALSAQGLSGLVVRGSLGRTILGTITGEAFARRVKVALDPAGRFPPLPWDTTAPSASKEAS